MPLSKSQQVILREACADGQEHGSLYQLVKSENQKRWAQVTKDIINFCVYNDIELYNLCHLKLSDGKELLNELINHFSLPVDLLQEQEYALWEKQALQWKQRFEAKLKVEQPKLAQLHASAYLSVAEQYLKKNTVKPDTLLTANDMSDLFTTSKNSDELVRSDPFSLTEPPTETLKALLRTNTQKNIFLPVTHDGHWFYLLRKGRVWSVNDSQPIVDSHFSPRQESILEESKNLLSKLLSEDIKPDFNTTGNQLNDYDCGTQVINAYRKEVDDTYEEKTHSEILLELLETQLDQEKFEQVPPTLLGSPLEKQLPQDLFNLDEDESPVYSGEEELELGHSFEELELTEREEQILQTTVSSQVTSEKVGSYQTHLKELMIHVKKSGIFAEIENKININDLDSAVAYEEESDEDFAMRLQEAEFRKAGI